MKIYQGFVNKDYNYLYLKIRKEAFLNTIYNKRSWEDISIGFQNRQFRNQISIIAIFGTILAIYMSLKNL